MGFRGAGVAGGVRSLSLSFARISIFLSASFGFPWGAGTVIHSVTCATKLLDGREGDRRLESTRSFLGGAVTAGTGLRNQRSVDGRRGVGAWLGLGESGRNEAERGERWRQRARFRQTLQGLRKRCGSPLKRAAGYRGAACTGRKRPALHPTASGKPRERGLGATARIRRRAGSDCRSALSEIDGTLAGHSLLTGAARLRSNEIRDSQLRLSAARPSLCGRSRPRGACDSRGREGSIPIRGPGAGRWCSR